ncbi:MAG: hypothetical protein ACP5KK_01895, partial [Candidatus Nanoarchaeia archaeon]
MATKKFKIKISPSTIVLLLLVLIVMISYSFHWVPFGAFSANQQIWENKLAVQANASQQFLQVHIVFGQYKPAICSEGIYIETEKGLPIPFQTQNEVYEAGLCKETDIVWKNIIYKEKQEQKQEPIFQIQGQAIDINSNETNET